MAGKVAFEGYPVRSNIPELYLWKTVLLGANGAALSPYPTNLSGQGGVTHARTGEGVYTLAFAANPGRFLDIVGFSFTAATMADVEDYKLAADTWDSSTWTLTYTVYAVTTAADLIADQYLSMTLAFQRGGSGL